MYDKRHLYILTRRFSDGSALSVQVASNRNVSHDNIRSAVLVGFGNLACTTYVSISSDDDKWHNVQYTVYRGGRVRRQRDW